MYFLKVSLHRSLLVNEDSQEIIAFFNTYPGNDCKLTMMVTKWSFTEPITFQLSASDSDDDLWLMDGTCSGTQPVMVYGAADVKSYMTENYPVKSLDVLNTIPIRIVNQVFGLDYKIDIYSIGYDGRPVFYRRIDSPMF